MLEQMGVMYVTAQKIDKEVRSNFLVWRIFMNEFLNVRRYLKTANILIIIITLIIISTTLTFAYYRAKYTESAHGDTNNGVNRSSLSFFGYSIGNCAHCHEQHSMIGGQEPTPTGGPDEYLLFYPNNPSSQNDNFCFQCHKSGSTIQSVTNYTYSTNFGGGTQTFTNIYDAFNPATGSTPSSHNLSDVLSHAISRSGGFTSDNNACVVCHDPHIAQRQYPVTSSGRGGVYTSIRRLYDYQNNPGNLWGDEDSTSGLNERMRDYTNNYQAPCYRTGTWPCPDAVNGPFEPANNNISDGSNLPNYRNFCLNNCHRRSNVTSTERGRNLIQVDWSSSGDEHGVADTGGSIGSCLNPYVNCDNSGVNFVLSCTDCHEPHGSQNEWLLRTTVNGTNVSVPGANQWLNFCSACHTISQHTAPWNSSTDCNSNGICHQHGQFF